MKNHKIFMKKIKKKLMKKEKKNIIVNVVHK